MAIELFANRLSNKHALAMSSESLLASTYSIGTALPSLEHRNRADVVLRFSPSTQSHGKAYQIRKLSPCGSIILGIEHAHCPNGHGPGTWNRSAERGLGGLRAVRLRDGRRISRTERGRKKKKEGLTSLERGFGI